MSEMALDATVANRFSACGMNRKLEAMAIVTMVVEGAAWLLLWRFAFELLKLLLSLPHMAVKSPQTLLFQQRLLLGMWIKTSCDQDSFVCL